MGDQQQEQPMLILAAAFLTVSALGVLCTLEL
jgi:hypothetical protein